MRDLIQKWKDIRGQISIEPETEQGYEDNTKSYPTYFLLALLVLKKLHLQGKINLDWEQVIEDYYLDRLIKKIEKDDLKNLFTEALYKDEAFPKINDEARILIRDFAKSIEFDDESMKIYNASYSKAFIYYIIYEVQNADIREDTEYLISKLIENGSNSRIFSLNSRVYNYIQSAGCRDVYAFSYDMKRFRTNKLVIFFADLDCGQVNLGDLTSDSCRRNSMDYVVMSANQGNKKYKQYNQQIYEELEPDSLVLDSDIAGVATYYNLQIEDLKQQIGNTNLRTYHVLQALIKLKVGGKLFLSVPMPAITSNNSQRLVRYLIDEGLLEGIIQPSASSDRLILTITNSSLHKNSIYFLLGDANVNSNNYLQSQSALDIIAKTYTDQLEVKYKAGYVSRKILIDSGYPINPQLITVDPETLESRNHGVKFDDLCEIRKGGSFAIKNNEPDDDSDYYLVTHSSISLMGDIIKDKLARIDSNEGSTQYEHLNLKENDILILAKATYFKSAVISADFNEFKLVCNNNLALLRVKNERVNPHYLNILLNSDYGRSTIIVQAVNNNTDNATISLSIKRLKEVRIKLPDLRTQQQIVDEYYANKKLVIDANLKFMEYNRKLNAILGNNTQQPLTTKNSL